WQGCTARSRARGSTTIRRIRRPFQTWDCESQVLSQVARAGALALLMTLTACTSASVRPSYDPFPNAAIDTIQADAAVVIREAAERIVARGLALRTNAPREGYLETRWFDLASRKSNPRGSDPNRIIRLRLYADAATPAATKLTVETVYRRNIDPSVPERQLELMVPTGSPGDTLARAVMAEVKRRHGGT